MKNIFSIVRSNRVYFISLSILLTAGCIMLLLQGSTVAFVSLNSFHPFWVNVFFINYTFMGDGIFAVCLILLYIFYFKKNQQGLALLYAFLLSGIVVQIIKNIISSTGPKLFFEPGQYLFFADNITITANSGFPSGHTATAFALATVFIVLLKNKNWQIPVLIAAALVGYSRIYLAQHFLIDALSGAVIGGMAGIVSVHMAYNTRPFKFSFSKKLTGKTEPVFAAVN